LWKPRTIIKWQLFHPLWWRVKQSRNLIVCDLAIILPVRLGRLNLCSGLERQLVPPFRQVHPLGTPEFIELCSILPELRNSCSQSRIGYLSEINHKHNRLHATPIRRIWHGISDPVQQSKILELPNLGAPIRLVEIALSDKDNGGVPLLSNEVAHIPPSVAEFRSVASGVRLQVLLLFLVYSTPRRGIYVFGLDLDFLVILNSAFLAQAVGCNVKSSRCQGDVAPCYSSAASQNHPTSRRVGKELSRRAVKWR
jgi:hypothetical protein